MREQALRIWLRARPPRIAELPHTSAQWWIAADEARRSGLAGLVLDAISRFRIPTPDGWAAGLHPAARALKAQNLGLRLELERCLLVLAGADIPTLLLKGAALNESLYGRFDLRPMSDLDVLVPPEQAVDAVEALVQSGFRTGVDLIRDDFYPRFHYERELWSASDLPVRIDLHARPLRPLRLARTMPADALWRNARSLRVGATFTHIPSPEAMLVHLAAHAAFHGCSRLIWLHDIHRLISTHPELDWDLVLRECNDWGLVAAVSLGISKTVEHLETPLPVDVRRRFADAHTCWRDRLVLRHAPQDAAAPTMHVMLNLLCTPGLRFKLGYLRAMLFAGRGHLGSFYARRHVGWTCIAHVRRVVGRLTGRSRAVAVGG